ncbi:MAG TPA: MerR family transcriptional regulator [Patescibacteria group bacterium]|nr:MerR family transcriptional regulator [Patescibacteria group bacterium]
MKDKKFTLSEASNLLGLHPKTLQRMDRKGVLKAERTLTNRRCYNMQDIIEFKRMRVLEVKKNLVDDILEAVGRYHARMES